MEAKQALFPLLVGQVPAYKEVITWLQFYYTGYEMGDYMVPVSTDLSGMCWQKESRFLLQ